MKVGSSRTGFDFGLGSGDLGLLRMNSSPEATRQGDPSTDVRDETRRDVKRKFCEECSH